MTTWIIIGGCAGLAALAVVVLAVAIDYLRARRTFWDECE